MEEYVLRVKLGRSVDPESGCDVVFDKLDGGNRPNEADDTSEAGPVKAPAGVVAGDVVLVLDTKTSVELARELDVEVKLPDAGTLISVVLAIFTLVTEMLVAGTGREDALVTLVICPDSLEDDPVGTVVKLPLEAGVGGDAVTDIGDSVIEARELERVLLVPVAPPCPEGPVDLSVKDVLLTGKGAVLVGIVF